MRLGGPISNAPEDPAELAQAHKDFGFAAAYCPKVELSDKDRIAAIEKAFKEADVVIAEVGAWCNMIAVEDDERKKNQQYVCERLALADEVGARCCVDYVGTLEPGKSWSHYAENLTQETFDMIVELARKILREVKPRRAKLTFEMMESIPPDSVDSCAEMVKAVDHPGFGVHLDPVNLILTPRQYFATGKLLEECFRKLGPWIASAHAKDIKIRNELSLHLDETRPGLGNLDYHTYVRGINSLDADVPLMLEHLKTEEDYAAARDYIVSVQREVDG